MSVPSMPRDSSQRVAKPSEYAEPVFDNRKWKLDSHSSAYNNALNDYCSFNHYILAGESTKNWSEKLTISFIPLEEKDESIFVNRDQVPDSLLQEYTGVSHPESDIWEWSKKTEQDVSSELVRKVSTCRGRHMFYYISKTNPLPPKVRAAWINNLKNIQIKKNY